MWPLQLVSIHKLISARKPSLDPISLQNRSRSGKMGPVDRVPLGRPGSERGFQDGRYTQTRNRITLARSRFVRHGLRPIQRSPRASLHTTQPTAQEVKQVKPDQAGVRTTPDWSLDAHSRFGSGLSPVRRGLHWVRLWFKAVRGSRTALRRAERPPGSTSPTRDLSSACPIGELIETSTCSAMALPLSSPTSL